MSSWQFLLWLRMPRVVHKFVTYVRRRRQHSYTELWEMLYGDDDQGKGFIREANFAYEVAAMHKQALDQFRGPV